MPVTPLIEAAEAFPAMERLVLRAERSVWMAFRIFDPETKLRDREALSLGLNTWLDLIRHALERGVDFHIRLTDFDPAGGPSLHRLCWRSSLQLKALAQEHPGKMTVFPAMHPHRVGAAVATLFWSVVRRRLQAALAVEPDAYEPPDYQAMREKGDVPLWPAMRIRPATHHEKVLVADANSAVIGGLDINERRYDTEDHTQPADQTWHDVSLRLEGADCKTCIADIVAHLAEGWNASQTIEQSEKPDPLPAMEHTGTPEGSLTFLRTASKQQEGSVVIAPRSANTSIEDATLKLISQAQRLIYIETQFLRSRKIADALADRLRERPSLNLVVVLPAAPDDIAFENNSDADARHGEWLQDKCVQTIRRAAGPRALFTSPVGARPASAEAKNADKDRDTVQGRWPIYVHSKVMITDMETAIVSSANLNGRSLRWDTESGVLWENDEAVRAFQMRLLTKHLRGADLPVNPAAEEVMHAVRECSKSDDASPLARYPHRRARKFAASRFFVPNNMV